MNLDEIYEIFNEDNRLTRSQANKVEFITTTRFIDKYLTKGKKILDVGAGTGAYSIHYAKQGYEVMAIEPVKRNLEILKSKISTSMKLSAKQGNALDLSFIEDNTYDIVICLGPLYHLKTEKEMLEAISEVKRVCKPGGVMYFAYISNDMVVVTETFLYNNNFLTGDSYNHQTFKVKDYPFVFLTVKTVKSLMAKAKLKAIHHFAADGLSELLSEKINLMDQETFNKWIMFHQYTCEKEELLGFSNHIVYVARNV